jgi:hypothetical protein
MNGGPNGEAQDRAALENLVQKSKPQLSPRDQQVAVELSKKKASLVMVFDDHAVYQLQSSTSPNDGRYVLLRVPVSKGIRLYGTMSGVDLKPWIEAAITEPVPVAREWITRYFPELPKEDVVDEEVPLPKEEEKKGT